MPDVDVIYLAEGLNWVVLFLSFIVLCTMLRRIKHKIANVNDLAVALISILVVLTMGWIIFGPESIWLRSGVATRIIFILIYIKLFFVGLRRS